MRVSEMDDSAKSESALQAAEDMTQWLVESAEYGMAPQKVQVIASYVAPWPWEPEDQEVHLVHFVLPNGREGVGVAGPVVYAFSDREIDFSLFEHDELLKLYAGWYLLFELIESEDYKPDFPEADDQEMIRILQEEHGIQQVQILDRVRIEDQTFFEMTGMDEDQPCRIGGSFEGCFSFYPDDKYYGLPALYYVMGWVFYADDEDDFDDEDEDDDDEADADDEAEDDDEAEEDEDEDDEEDDDDESEDDDEQ